MSRSKYSTGDAASEIVLLEETVANSEISQAINLLQSINQSNKQSNNAAKIDLDYVRRCLNELNTQSVPATVKGSVGPREEFAYALQSLSNQSNKPANKQANKQHDRSVVVSVDKADTQYASINQSVNPISALRNDCGDVIVAEDEIPKQFSNQSINQSINQLIQNEKLQALENRLAYVSECLRQVQSNINQSVNATSQSTGPEDDQAWNIIKDKHMTNQSNGRTSNQPQRIRSKL